MITDYYGRIMRCAMNFNVYVPPLHTLQDGVPPGSFHCRSHLIPLMTSSRIEDIMMMCLFIPDLSLLPSSPTDTPV